MISLLKKPLIPLSFPDVEINIYAINRSDVCAPVFHNTKGPLIINYVAWNK
ncbi:Uncharacterized protein DAT39_022830, partial [Clarias magur]